MKIAAVICEFNPFHNGHKYLIDKIKKEHADYVIAIMSGHFVQRGDVAITDKFKRTEIALKSGADLVVELPTVFALSSAERFAKGGVQIAKALNADMLCFGAEDDNIQMLSRISNAFYDEIFTQKLKEYMSNGEYYPKAVSKTIEEVLSKEHSEILDKPNNTLAIEYIKALKDTGITPVAIKRSGAQHDSDVTSSSIASATHIRKLIHESIDYSDFAEFKISNYTNIDKLQTAILYKLRSMSKDELENLPDVSEGLHNRIYDCCRKSNSLEELYSNLKTKRYTLARLRRIVLYALLNITQADMYKNAEYVRVLGFSKNGAEIIKNCTTLPIVAKVKNDYRKLSDNAKKQFDIDIHASEVFALALNNNTEFQNEFSAKIIKI